MLRFLSVSNVAISLHQFFHVAHRYIPAVFDLEGVRKYISVFDPAPDRVLVSLKQIAEIFDGEQFRQD